jgi:DNA polymerase
MSDSKTTDTDLATRLETFVREQAAQFGEVISYVPAKRIAVAAPSPASTITSADAASPTAQSTMSFDALQAKVLEHKEEGWTGATSLDILQAAIHDCTKCGLAATRNKFVFGTGSPTAKVMVIGEAPGADEDMKGEPFVGRAGQLLTKMLEAIRFSRDEVFITNILKSRPPNNRDPKPEEVEACEPYLWKQILLIRPQLILCVGRIAGSNLLKLPTESLGKMRGKVFDYYGSKVMVTYHPAALLRNPDWKKGAWEDLQKFRSLYDEFSSV